MNLRLPHGDCTQGGEHVEGKHGANNDLRDASGAWYRVTVQTHLCNCEAQARNRRHNEQQSQSHDVHISLLGKTELRGRYASLPRRKILGISLGGHTESHDFHNTPRQRRILKMLYSGGRRDVHEDTATPAVTAS